ncbi:MAG: MFS transporter [Prevotella sp.]|nr:MFS transporter [Prevotella sp.]
MMMGYVFWDIVSPLSTTLKAPLSEGGMAWTATEYGFYAGSYSIFNIFLLMLFLGGVILDKCGIRFTGLLATGLMLGGAAVNWWALTSVAPTHYVDMPVTLFGLIPCHMKTQVLVSAIGFGLFGVGCDITGITVSKVVTKWFTGHELASAMGIQVAMARLGTASAISLSPVIAQSFGLSAPLLVGTLLLLVGFLMFVGYTVMDRRLSPQPLPKREGSKYSQGVQEVQNVQGVQGVQNFQEVQEKGHSTPLPRREGQGGGSAFALIALLCVLFYTSLRPFLKFATDVLVNKYGLDPITAGWIVSLLPYGTIVLTPLFGNIYDRIGRGATLMLAGSGLVLVCHVVLALPMVNATWVATVVMILLGVAFSLVPSAMWPSVPKLVPLKWLGTSYSIIYYVQNIGLMLAPMLVGNIIDRHTAPDGHVDFTVPMSVFALLALGATFTAALLLIMDKRHHYGLEQANISKKQS